MSALLSGYASSDDDDLPGPSNVNTAPTVAHADENDEAIEAQARVDAFGLSSAGSAKASKVVTKLAVMAAPDVLKDDPNSMGNAIIARPTDQVVNVNLKYDDMMKPVQGPEDPFNQSKNKGMNSLAGELSSRRIRN